MVLMSEERSVKKEFMVMIMFFLFTLMLYRPIAFQFANNLRNYYCLVRVLKFSGGSEVKTSACNDGDPGSIAESGRFLWRMEWQPTPEFLLGESRGQKSLAGYSPWGHKELDTTERLTLSLSLQV